MPYLRLLSRRPLLAVQWQPWQFRAGGAVSRSAHVWSLRLQGLALWTLSAMAPRALRHPFPPRVVVVSGTEIPNRTRPSVRFVSRVKGPFNVNDEVAWGDGSIEMRCKRSDLKPYV